MALHRPPTAEQNRASDQVRNAPHAPSTPPSPSPSQDPLRNAPTFALEDKDSSDKGKDTQASNDAGPGPRLAEKMMQKLGLNPIILMNMFKSVPPSRRRVCTAQYLLEADSYGAACW